MERVLSDLSGLALERISKGYYRFARPLVDFVVDEKARGNLTDQEVSAIEDMVLLVRSILSDSCARQMGKNRLQAGLPQVGPQAAPEASSLPTNHPTPGEQENPAGSE